MTEMKDSGERTQFDGGSIREDASGKGMPSLLQLISIMKVSQVAENGAIKYAKDNWRKGQPLSRYLDSAMRHLFKFTMNWKDEEHLSMCIWNLMSLQETQAMIEMGKLPSELNDIPNEFFKGDDMSKLMEENLGLK